MVLRVPFFTSNRLFDLRSLRLTGRFLSLICYLLLLKQVPIGNESLKTTSVFLALLGNFTYITVLFVHYFVKTLLEKNMIKDLQCFGVNFAMDQCVRIRGLLGPEDKSFIAVSKKHFWFVNLVKTFFMN